MNKFISSILIALILAFAEPAVAQDLEIGSGPSFDCDKASNATEHAICKSRELSSLDRQLDAAYSAANGAHNGKTPYETLRENL